MTRPSTDAPWATTTNYPHDGAPEQDEPTKVSYTQSSLGYRPDEIPDAQEENDWRNLVGRWTTYLKSITEAKWVWLPAGAGQQGASPTTAAVFLPQGFFGETGHTNYVSVGVPIPEGCRIKKVGIRYRHAAGEANGGVTGSLWLNRLNSPANGVNAANTPIYIQSNPAQAINPTINIIEVLGNNSGGAKWETITVDVADTSDYNLAAPNVSFVLVGGAGGTAEIESVGYQFQPES